MILEIAEVHVKEGQEAGYMDAVRQAQHLVTQTEGYISHTLQQSIEEPTRFMLLIYWESVEAHMVNFRESENFTLWREYTSPFFTKPPHVQHFELRHSNPNQE